MNIDQAHVLNEVQNEDDFIVNAGTIEHVIDMSNSISILSYNINFGMMKSYYATDSARILAATIEKQNANIVICQESNEYWESFLGQHFINPYPHQLFRAPQKFRASGMCCLSQWPVKELKWMPSKHGWFHAWAIQVKTPEGPIQILSVHMKPSIEKSSVIPNPRVFWESRKQRLEDMQDWFSQLDQNLATVILGDFNESSTGVFSGLTGEWLESSPQNFTDAIKEFDPNTFTWIWPVSLITLKAQFDHIFYQRSKVKCLVGQVVQEGPSDHFPVVAKLKLMSTKEEYHTL